MAVAANRGTGGSVLDAQYGSSSTSNTNEPLLLAHTGTNYLYTSGVTGNFASTPHSSALDITGDIDIRVRVALDNWTPAVAITLVSKGYGACWYVFLGTTTLGLGVSLSGGTVFPTVTWSSRPANGTAIWLRVTRVASTGGITFLSAADSADVPASWTTLGTVTSTAGNFVSDSSKYVGIGAAVSNPSASFEHVAGKFYRAQILSGIDGTVVFDANFATGITSGGQTTFTESSSNAATVTINRSTSGRKSVAVVRPVWLLGTDDYFTVPDNALLEMTANQDFTVLAVVRQWGTPSANQVFISKGYYGLTGYSLVSGSGAQGFAGAGGTYYWYGSVTSISNSLAVMSMTRNGTTMTAYKNTTVQGVSATFGTMSGTLANGLPLNIGKDSGNFADTEILAVAVFRRALTATEIASIVTFYGAV